VLAHFLKSCDDDPRGVGGGDPNGKNPWCSLCWPPARKSGKVIDADIAGLMSISILSSTTGYTDRWVKDVCRFGSAFQRGLIRTRGAPGSLTSANQSVQTAEFLWWADLIPASSPALRIAARPYKLFSRPNGRTSRQDIGPNHSFGAPAPALISRKGSFASASPFTQASSSFWGCCFGMVFSRSLSASENHLFVALHLAQLR